MNFGTRLAHFQSLWSLWSTALLSVPKPNKTGCDWGMNLSVKLMLAIVMAYWVNISVWFQVWNYSPHWISWGKSDVFISFMGSFFHFSIAQLFLRIVGFWNFSIALALVVRWLKKWNLWRSSFTSTPSFARSEHFRKREKCDYHKSSPIPQIAHLNRSTDRNGPDPLAILFSSLSILDKMLGAIPAEVL